MMSAKLSSARSKSILIAIFFTAILCGFDSVALSARSNSQADLKQKIINAINDRNRRGESFDLKHRKLDAKFIEDLLTGSIKKIEVGRYGIRLSHAEIDEPIDLENADIRYDIRFTYCRFKQKVNLTGSHFHSNLYFDHSRFAALDCENLKVDGDLSIKGDSNSSQDDPKLSGLVNFDDANIKGDFNISGAHFTPYILDEQTLNSDIWPITFERLVVAGDMKLKNTEFIGPVNFTRLSVAGNLEADNVRFKCLDDKDLLRIFRRYPKEMGDSKIEKEHNNIVTGFIAVKVGGDAKLRDAVFYGRSTFEMSTVSGIFDGSGIWFLHQHDPLPIDEEYWDASFNGLKAGGMFLRPYQERNACFMGRTDFTKLSVSNNFEADFIHFGVPPESKVQPESNIQEYEVSFNSIKVDGHAMFKFAMFAGSVDFRDSVITGSFIADGAVFNESSKEDVTINFEDMRVSDDIRFVNNMTFLDTYLPTTPEILPSKGFKYIFGDMAYQRLLTSDNEDDWRPTLYLVDHSDYSADAYAALEAYFLRQGHPDRANQVFIAQQAKETELLPTGYQRLGRNLLRLLIGYGKEPWRAFIASFFVIVIGWIVFFKKSYMELKKEDTKVKLYRPFWYSFSLFVPAVDLGASSVWQPKDVECEPWLLFDIFRRWRSERRQMDRMMGRICRRKENEGLWQLIGEYNDHEKAYIAHENRCRHYFALYWRQFYMRIHILLGWILIPIGLLALTGLIK